jgi:hypothetical protein
MTPEVVGNLDFWLHALCTYPEPCDLSWLLERYRRALDTL